MKTVPGRVGAAPDAAAQRPCQLPNLLYKRTFIPAASGCAKMVWRLGFGNSWFVLRTRSGPGKKTSRSSFEA